MTFSPTMRAALRSSELADRKRAERDPTVAAVLHRVPEAAVVAVRLPTGRSAKVAAAAKAMAEKRRELIAQPLDRIWEQLAAAAIDAAALVE